MANMSYCRFHNTTMDLNECVGIIEEAYDEGMNLDAFHASLSTDEAHAFRQMIRLAEKLTELVSEMEQFEGWDEEVDEEA